MSQEAIALLRSICTVLPCAYLYCIGKLSLRYVVILVSIAATSFIVTMLQKSICDKPYGDKPYGNRIGDIATFCFAAVVVSWTFILVMVCFVVAIMYKLYRLVREQREQQVQPWDVATVVRIQQGRRRRRRVVRIIRVQVVEESFTRGWMKRYIPHVPEAA